MEKETDIIDDETNCINLVFFGETGVGKSTLINSKIFSIQVIIFRVLRLL